MLKYKNYNSLGVEVIRTEIDLIDINTLPTGIYIINVIQDVIVERVTFVKN